MMSLACCSTCYFFYGYRLLGDFFVPMFVLSTRLNIRGKASVLYVVQRCVYYALHVGKKKTPCHKYIYFFKRLRERRLKGEEV